MKRGRLLLVEELSTLKESCREVIVTFEDRVNVPSIPGAIVHAVSQGRQAVCLVRESEEQQYYDLQNRSDVRTVDVRRPSLEDIFVAYMRSDDGSSQSVVAPLEARSQEVQ